MYKRVLLKLSGESLGGSQGKGLDPDSLRAYAREIAAKMGMLATVINSLALATFIKEEGVDAQVFTALPMEPIANYYMRDKAVAFLEKGGVALIAGGTGNPGSHRGKV